MKQFVEIFGVRSMRDSSANFLTVIDYFNNQKHTEETFKNSAITVLVNISDIARFHSFVSEYGGESYYLVIIRNQCGTGNFGKELNELGLIISDPEYVNLKEFLND